VHSVEGSAPESNAADALIERCSRYLERPPNGYSYYEFWLDSEEEARPGATAEVRAAARGALASARGPVLRSAIQALACCGDASDVTGLSVLRASDDAAIAFEASEAIKYIQHRAKSLRELLEEVDSRESFIAFVEALAKEREAAEKLERADPERYGTYGALGWENGRISSFLDAGLTRFESWRDEEPPTWRAFAEFLYHGRSWSKAAHRAVSKECVQESGISGNRVCERASLRRCC
jgi:hypothetical protein